MKKISRKQWRRQRLHHISPTGTISKFTDCPLQFWFHKIAKVEDKSKEKPYLAFGNALHASHEEALNFKQKNKSIVGFKNDILGKFTETLTKCAKDVPDYMWGKEGIDSHVAVGKKMVDMLIDRYETMPIKPLLVEKAFSLPYCKDINLDCRIDLVAEFTDDWISSNGDRISKGDVLIIDHKTASQKYKPSAVHISDQLTFYALVVREVEKLKETGVMFQTFMKYKTPEIIDYYSQRNNRDINILKEKIDSILVMVDKGIFYPTLKPDVCTWCDYTNLCPTYALKEKREEYEKELAAKESFSI